MNHQRLRLIFLRAILYLLLSNNAFADRPSLEALQPPIVARGQDCEVTVQGSSLKDLQDVLFYREGISCIRIESVSDEESRIHLRVESSSPLGRHPIRVRSKQGISELRTVTVSPFPLLFEDRLDSNPLPLENRTIVGTLSGRDADKYRINLAAGNHFSAEVNGIRLGCGMLDTKLTLRGPDGVVLLQADDTPILHQDPCFSAEISADGIYELTVESTGNADAGSYYALHLGDFPRPLGLFPPGASNAQDTHVTLLGSFAQRDSSHSVNPSRDDEQSAILPTKGLPLGLQWVELVVEGVTCPSPVPFFIAGNEVSMPVLSVDRNDEGIRVEPVAPTLATGIIREKGQTDAYDFSPTWTGVCVVELFASRLGSLLDSVVVVRDEAGQMLASGDDFDGHDSRIEIHVREGHRYRLEVSDKRQQSGEFYQYCIQVAPPSQVASLFLPRRDKLSQNRQTIEVPRGNRVLGLFGVRDMPSLDHFPNGLKVLPSTPVPDVEIESAILSKETFVVPVVFSASENAPELGGLIELKVDSSNTDVTQTEQASRQFKFEQVVDLVHGPADSLYESARVSKLALSVVEEAPFHIDLVEPTVAIPVDGSLVLHAVVTRAPGFNNPIDISIPILPEGIDAPPFVRVPGDQSEARIELNALANANVTRWPLVAEGKAAIGTGGDISAALSNSPLSLPIVCSNIHQLEIGESPFSGKIRDLSAEQGGSVWVACEMKAISSWTHPLTATLEGLPNRVHAESVSIDASSQEIRFQLKLDHDCPVGDFSSVYCRLQSKTEGEEVAFCIARGTKLSISRVGDSKVDSEGRPLSRLQALRQSSKQSLLKPE